MAVVNSISPCCTRTSVFQPGRRVARPSVWSTRSLRSDQLSFSKGISKGNSCVKAGRADHEILPKNIGLQCHTGSELGSRASKSLTLTHVQMSESMVENPSSFLEPKFASSKEEEKIYLNQAINAALVICAISATLFKVFTIDQDYWTGWTVLEIVQNAPLHNWMAYEAMLQSNPVFAKMIISGVVYTVGDWIAQCYEGNSPLGFDRVRMVRSGLVGFLLHGSLSHYYYNFCEWLFPFQGWWVVPLKVGFDQTVWSGVWNSIYYTMLGLLRLEDPRAIWKELKETFVPLLTAGWKLWPFAHIITYGVVPVEQRLLWVDMVELIWVTILSMMANEKAQNRMSVQEVDAVPALTSGVGGDNAEIKNLE